MLVTFFEILFYAGFGCLVGVCLYVLARKLVDFAIGSDHFF